VIDPGSVQVNRRGRRVKTDRVDVEASTNRGARVAQRRGRYSPWNVRSLQFGRTVAPSLPHLLNRIRGPKGKHREVVWPPWRNGRSAGRSRRAHAHRSGAYFRASWDGVAGRLWPCPELRTDREQNQGLSSLPSRRRRLGTPGRLGVIGLPRDPVFENFHDGGKRPRGSLHRRRWRLFAGRAAAWARAAPLNPSPTVCGAYPSVGAPAPGPTAEQEPGLA